MRAALRERGKGISALRTAAVPARSVSSERRNAAGQGGTPPWPWPFCAERKTRAGGGGAGTRFPFPAARTVAKTTAACLLAIVTAAWGFRYDLGPEEPVVQAVNLSEPEISLAPGEWAPGGAAFRNLGTVPCRLRVKLCANHLEGQPVLEAGCRVDGKIVPAGSVSPESGEYWTAQGEYLYYRNPGTGDMLPPGCESLPAYDAVRLNDGLPQEVLAELPGEQALFVVAQARREGGDWVNIGG